MPKVSVIIPAYNCGNLIERTILSVCNQTFKDWELIIVDDGSTDKTKEVVLSFQKKDSRIKYFFQNNSGAPAKPKNVGILNATGKYIAFLDHDDEWVPKKLEKQIGVFEKTENQNLGLVVSGAMIVSEIDNSKKEYKISNISNHILALLERNFIFCSSGVMTKREVFSNVGLFDENFRFGDDWDMWVRISKNFDFDFICEPLYYFYRHPMTMTSKTKNDIKIKDYEYGLSKHLDLYKNHPKQFSNRLLAMGRICYIAGAKKKGIKFFLKSILVNPLNWRSYVNLCFSLLGPYCYRIFVNLRKNSQ